ncbi:MAG: hypothetical protein LBK73_12645 [Treponema sp.]|jgi:hypothetical protein|nr:hypothetical protein [Treponema sp.]
MVATKGWLPTAREGALAMARVWTTLRLSKMTGRGVLQAAMAALQALLQAAAALETAGNAATRTSRFRLYRPGTQTA